MVSGLAGFQCLLRTNMAMRKIWINFTLILMISSTVLVRSGAGDDFQTWEDITTIYNFSDRWRYDADQGMRGVLSDDDFTLLYFRPSVRYRAKSWFMIHGGIRFFKTFFDDEKDTFEIGPWQGLWFGWPKIGGYGISHYLRLEQRMTWQTQGESNSDFTLRARYQLGVRSPNYEILLPKGIFWLASIEFFSNLDENFSDNPVNRVRYVVGVGTKVSDAWRVELHHIRQDAIATDDEVFNDPFDSEESILRLRLFYSFN